MVLPIIERKIEEVLEPPDPQECFTDKAADPGWVCRHRCGSMIAIVGDEQAIKEISQACRDR